MNAPPKRAILVVGATGRLGVAVAHALRARGDRVLLTARSEEKLRALDMPYIVADLLDPEAPAKIADGAKRAGGIDDVILACGPFPRTPFATVKREEIASTLTVHAVSPLLLVQALVPQLVASRGAVIALTDAGVTRPYPNHIAYLAAKGALQTGLRALAVELAPDVRVNMVALGVVSDPDADGDPLRTHRLATRSPLGRMGTPDEVAHVVLALLDSTWATGEIWGVGR